MLLRGNLEPTDFADAEVRVSRWVETAPMDGWSDSTVAAYRVWVCRCTAYWFHRHEWRKEGANQSEMDGWTFYGYFPHKRWEAHLQPAPNLEEL